MIARFRQADGGYDDGVLTDALPSERRPTTGRGRDGRVPPRPRASDYVFARQASSRLRQTPLTVSPTCTHRLPLLTLAVAATALLLHLSLPATAVLQYDRAAVAAGQWWRLASGHLVHWNASHLGWDVAVFALLGIACERQSRVAMMAAVVGTGVALAVVLQFCTQQVELYRGLSGVDSALFMLLVVRVALQSLRRCERLTAAVALAVLTLFGLKLLIEVLTGQTLFARTDGDFVPMPLAHAAGGIVGASTALLFSMRDVRPGRGVAAVAARSAPRRKQHFG